MNAPAPGAMVVPLRLDEDMVRLRQQVREQLVAQGFSLIDQTKMVTAASELARNTLRYGGGGEAHLLHVANGMRRGLQLVFTDDGPGIDDIPRALTDGYTSGGGMGLGLSGAKRLADEFDITSAPGAGTTVSITKWKPY
ncbi:anti-sigma regulatory factor [Massilia sp. Root351]|jgi:serine/threonine-protein kinase RsbT|uniref:anti-sigma regulatory factor n=1 Tax=Massilia sp. Root351 TaxID=1736522 RepID=UPI00070E74E9|nr:anti-sigma regulatory factor [Massilia sp. Root351]KQV82333.1 anti-sigma regulatory factor [Massilia sp. Root351]